MLSKAKESGERKKIAIVGSGLSGISAAYLLSKSSDFEVTLFEQNHFLGGEFYPCSVPGIRNRERELLNQPLGPEAGRYNVDAQPLVFNPSTSPNIMALCQELQVPVEKFDMGMTLCRNFGELEWTAQSKKGLSGILFTQWESLFSLNMYKMIYDITRFHQYARQLISLADNLEFDADGHPVPEVNQENPIWTLTLGTFLCDHSFSKAFVENYILPMASSIWSISPKLAYNRLPVIQMLRYMKQNGLLQFNKFQEDWKTLSQGCQSLINAALEKVDNVVLSTQIIGLKSRSENKVVLVDEAGNDHEFNHLILAVKAHDALNILGDFATEKEKEILPAFKYTTDKGFVHRDYTLMPSREAAWAYSSFFTLSKEETDNEQMFKSTWLNKARPDINVKTHGDIYVTVNGVFPPTPDFTFVEFNPANMIPSLKSVAAQEKMSEIQQVQGVSFAGSWTETFGHEDSCTSGLLAARSLGAKSDFLISLNGGFPTRKHAKTFDSKEKEGMAETKFQVQAPPSFLAVNAKYIFMACFAVLLAYWVSVILTPKKDGWEFGDVTDDNVVVVF